MFCMRNPPHLLSHYVVPYNLPSPVGFLFNICATGQITRRLWPLLHRPKITSDALYRQVRRNSHVAAATSSSERWSLGILRISTDAIPISDLPYPEIEGFAD